MAKFVDVGTPTMTKASDLKPGTLVHVGSPAILDEPGIISNSRCFVSLITGEVFDGNVIVTPLLTGQTITLAQE